MRIRWIILLAALAFGAFPKPAAAVTVQDLVELTRAGLGDDVLVALVETSGAVYSLTTQEIIELKVAGVSERVIVVMLKQGRMGDAAAPVRSEVPDMPVSPMPDFGPESWRTDAPGADPRTSTPVPTGSSTVVVIPTAVPFPVFVSGTSPRWVKTPAVRPADRSGGFGRFINDGFRTATPIDSWGPVAPLCSPRGRK